MGVPIVNFLRARRDRAVATILGHLEREVYGYLSVNEQRECRSVVLSAIDAYHDAVLDLAKSEEDIRNQRLVDLLDRLDRQLA